MTRCSLPSLLRNKLAATRPPMPPPSTATVLAAILHLLTLRSIPRISYGPGLEGRTHPQMHPVPSHTVYHRSVLEPGNGIGIYLGRLGKKLSSNFQKELH